MRDVKILGILGDSEGIDVEADKQAISKLPGAFVRFLNEPKRADFAELWDDRWDILFFAGHSETEGDGQTGLLYINPDDKLNIEEIRKTLIAAREQGLKLAIFNSCDGLGLARQLADLNIPQIIVWREPVPDLVAQKFLKYFLTSFAGGKSLYRSVREAKDKLRELEPEIEAELPGVTALPVICQNMADEPVTWEKLRGCSGDSISDDPKPVNWLNQMILSVGIKNILLGMTMVGITLSFTTNINIYTGKGTTSLPPTTSHPKNTDMIAPGTTEGDIKSEQRVELPEHIVLIDSSWQVFSKDIDKDIDRINFILDRQHLQLANCNQTSLLVKIIMGPYKVCAYPTNEYPSGSYEFPFSPQKTPVIVGGNDRIVTGTTEEKIELEQGVQLPEHIVLMDSSWQVFSKDIDRINFVLDHKYLQPANCNQSAPLVRIRMGSYEACTYPTNEYPAGNYEFPFIQ